MKKTIGRGLCALALGGAALFALLTGCAAPPSKPQDELQDTGKFTVDGSLADWTQEDREHGVFLPVQDGQSAHIYAKKIESGALVAVEAVHHRFVTGSKETFSNSNFRFAFANGEERYVTAAGESAGVSDYKISSVSDGTMRTTVFEIFVAKEDISTFDAGLRFGFRLHLSGYQEDYFWGYGGDWRADECDYDDCTYYLTEQGILPKVPLEGRVKVDGNVDEEWESVPVLTSNYNDYGAMQMRAFLSEDGVYFLLSATHKEWDSHQYWCYNPNFELRLGASPAEYATVRVVKYSKELALVSSTATAAYEIAGEKGAYTSVCELFVPWESIPGGSMERGVRVGASFRADESDISPWVPFYYEGRSSWDMNSLTLTVRGWEGKV